MILFGIIEILRLNNSTSLSSGTVGVRLKADTAEEKDAGDANCGVPSEAEICDHAISTVISKKLADRDFRDRALDLVYQRSVICVETANLIG